MNNRILIYFKMFDTAVNLAAYFYCDTPLIFTLNMNYSKYSITTNMAVGRWVQNYPYATGSVSKTCFHSVSAPTTCLHISNRLKSSVINTTKQISFGFFFPLLKMLSLSTMPSYEIMAENKCDEYDEQMLSIEEMGARFATSSINVY